MAWTFHSKQRLADRRTLLDIALILLLWPVLMIYPYPPETYLDASWMETLVYAHAHGWQFGRELIFTWGPWGFLESFFHLGDTSAGVRLVWELAGKFLIALGLVAGTRQLRPFRQAAFVGAFLLCAPEFLDCAYLLFITVMVLGILLRPGVPRGWSLAAVVALAFLAQIKFTYALLAGAGVGVALLVLLGRRNWRAAGVLAAGFLLAFVGWWLAAGQNPDNIYPYFRRSWEVSTGYAAAMGVDETAGVFFCGLAVLAFQADFLRQVWRREADRMQSAGTVLFLGAAWLLTWKHGFIRADGHVLGFFLYALPVSLILPALCLPGIRWHWLDLAVVPCLAGLWLFEPDLPARLPGDLLNRLGMNVTAVFHLPTRPAAWRAELDRARDANRLPAVRRAVGTSSVDVYNYEQGAALLNELNFSPRPVFQGYTVYSPGLAWRNLRHYQSSAAPEFLLWHQSTIDGRFPTLDEAPLVAELPRGYREVLAEGDFLLLQRNRPLPSTPLAREFLDQQSAGLGETIPVPAAPDCALWVQIFPDATKVGRLRALLYKPAQLNLTVEEVTGRQTTWRLLPTVAADGFLLSPFLETQEDFSAYLQGRGQKRIKSIRLEAPEGGREFWKGVAVRFYALHEMPVTYEAPYLALVRQGIADAAPTKVVTTTPIEYFTAGPDQAALLNAPAEMEFSVPADATRLRAGFGLRPGSYDQGGRTDGVEFIVMAGWPDGHTSQLWQRRLDPLQQTADRGTQTIDLSLPADRPSTVTLQTRPSTAGRNGWDWSYWTRIRFTPAPRP